MKKAFSPSPLTLGHSTTPDSMKANPKSAAPIEPFVNDGLSDEGISNSFRRASNRWSYNGAEKLVTSGVPKWDLADDFGKLKLGNSSDDGSTIQALLRTILSGTRSKKPSEFSCARSVNVEDCAESRTSLLYSST